LSIETSSLEFVLPHTDEDIVKLTIPQNILIKGRPPDHPWWVKIGDFGISKRAETIIAPSIMMGTPGFMAPELLDVFQSWVNPGHVLGATDIWALGETIYRALVKQPCFRDRSAVKQYVNGDRPCLPPPGADDAIDDKARQFLEGLMKALPQDRFSATLALAHEWLAPVPVTRSRSSSITFDE
jgi:serine/threonine protein kinase